MKYNGKLDPEYWAWRGTAAGKHNGPDFENIAYSPGPGSFKENRDAFNAAYKEAQLIHLLNQGNNHEL